MESIFAHHSKKIDNLNVNDLMFNEWGVVHLHLGVESDSNDPRFVQRTGPLLFVLLSDKEAYLIGVGKHGDWTDSNILKTIYENWPQLIERNIVDAKGISYELTSAEHAGLRKENINAVLAFESGGVKIYYTPIGIATSGDSIRDVRNYMRVISILNITEQEIIENKEENLEKIKNIGGLTLSDIECRLEYDDGWYVVEINSEVIISRLSL
ncbi:hypothetical protein RI065_10415 [Mycoplasmatota bacterium zrk1]